MPDSDLELAAEVLQQVAHLLRRLTPEEIDDLTAGVATLTVQYKPGKQRSSSKAAKISPIEEEEILARLHTLQSREEGIEYLQDMKLTRAALTALARRLEAPVQKSDNLERLRERLVEASIGYRLRSQAIRGHGQ